MKGKTAALALACALALLWHGVRQRADDRGDSRSARQHGGACAGKRRRLERRRRHRGRSGGRGALDGDAGAPAADRQVIRTANLSLETKQYDEALALVRGAAAESGGYIEHTASYADSGARSTSFTCRIPAAAYAEFLEAVRAAGSVQYAEEGTKDATNEYVDLEARLKSLRTQETRLLALLEESGSLEELLAVQEKLTAVQYEIERYTGEMKALENSIEYAAVSVYVEGGRSVHAGGAGLRRAHCGGLFGYAARRGVRRAGRYNRAGLRAAALCRRRRCHSCRSALRPAQKGAEGGRP